MNLILEMTKRVMTAVAAVMMIMKTTQTREIMTKSTLTLLDLKNFS